MGKITIISCGMGTPDQLTGEARQALETAKRALATKRLARELSCIYPNIQEASTTEILSILGTNSSDMVVLVTGDAGFFSLAAKIIASFKDREIHIIPGISSLQALCAKLGKAYQDVKVVSLHGREGRLEGPISYHHKVFALAGGTGEANSILQSLCQSGLGFVTVSVGENLGAANERIVTGTVTALIEYKFDGLSVLLFENPNPASRAGRLRDDDFIRGDVPMTKEAVRILALSKLEVESKDVVYDIGAGTGSVSVALARAAWEGVVYAIEQKPEALALLQTNRQKLGAYNAEIVPGTAPETLVQLPPPTKVFVGGSRGQLESICAALKSKSSAFTLCITAVTLETLQHGLTLLEQTGFTQVEVECINHTKVRKAGGYHMLQAQNPVYLISGRWQA